MKTHRGAIATIGLAMTLTLALPGFAQQSSVEESKRKVRTKVTPSYPELARRMRIFGKVKVEVVIAPDGHVRVTRLIGGHPVLAQAAISAAKEWRFYAAGEETTQIVEFDFHNPNN